jgi:4-amino-4-deoxy-L-arabinose transferase-like glycosyltransferase
MIDAEAQRKGIGRRLARVAVLLLILALAAYLRLANVTENPGWYTDEGTHLDVARNLLRGRVQYLAVTQSTLLFARPPLFGLLLAALLRVTSGGIDVLRRLTGALGVVSVGLLYGFARRASRDAVLALLAAAVLAVYPQAIVYSRFGFSYNLLAPLVLLATWGLWEYLGAPRAHPGGRRWLALAALAVGVGSLCDLWAFALLAPLVAVVLKREPRDLLWSLPLLLLPFALYAGWMLAIVPDAFLFDLRFTLFRLGRLSLPEQAMTLARNVATLFFQDGWGALSVAGLFVLRPTRLRRLSLVVLLLPAAILGRTAPLYSLGAYYTIPLLPLVGLGVGSLLRHGAPYAVQTVAGALPAVARGRAFSGIVRPAVYLALAAPFTASLALSLGQVRDGFGTSIDPFLLDPADARRVAGFVNGRVAPGDVVVASPSLAWLIDANVADVQLATVVAGYPAPDLPAAIPAGRFAFDPHYARARYVVVDDLWRTWGVWNVPGVPDVLRELESWPLVYRGGEIVVYANPANEQSALPARGRMVAARE